ncbi:hypothetical protein Poli38472_013767 [Pythium oligandrum]|uniref:CSC1/OSCA1-like 7TM region domain-containing protein n=1 Tax=Pythium oligandrum TaxID=41045 RepID=A0A8K1FHR9_PYTOL|nr:hypothetical protein Poli38472_013767 [Pythium oligandrum]|eukprot:TMW61304.1 hypothetical protein Poli38472_013767 [Pythium oligandrum]
MTSLSRAMPASDAAPTDNSLMGLLMDDEDGAAGISQAEIIERQAETIARLERHAEKAKEYKTLTKVKLKEAAQRLREYRMRVEALMGEVEQLKKEQAATKRSRASTSAAKTTKTVSIGVQTEAMRKPAAVSVTVQTEKPVSKSTEVQTDMLVAGIDSDRTKTSPSVNATKLVMSAVPSDEAVVTSTQTPRTQTKNQMGKAARPSVPFRPMTKASVNKTKAEAKEPVKLLLTSQSDYSTGATVEEKSLPPAAADAISAAIDAELASSDDEELPTKPSSLPVPSPSTVQATGVAEAITVDAESGGVHLDDEISREIDRELDFSSSSSSSSDSSSSDEEEPESHQQSRRDDKEFNFSPNAKIPHPLLDADTSIATISDPIGAAIDADLASSSEDEDLAMDVEEMVFDGTQDPGAHASLLVSNADESAFVAVSSTADPIRQVSHMVSEERGIIPPESSMADAISAAIDAELVSSDEEENAGNQGNTMPEHPVATRDAEPKSKVFEQQVERRPITNPNEPQHDSVELSLSSGGCSDSGSSSEEDFPTRNVNAVTEVPSVTSGIAIITESKRPPEEKVTDVGSSLSTRIQSPINHVEGEADISTTMSEPRTLTCSTTEVSLANQDKTGELVKKRVADAKSKVQEMEPPKKKGKANVEHRSKVEHGIGNVEVLLGSRTRQIQAPVGTLTAKEIVAFRNVISTQEGEIVDEHYVMRTLTALIRVARPLFHANPASQMGKLCRLLSDEYRRHKITASVLIDGVVRVFRTPRTRNIAGSDTANRGVVALCELFQAVFFKTLHIDVNDNEDTSRSSVIMTPDLQAVLARLRDLVVVGRLAHGFLPVKPSKPPAGLDKMFQRYVCAFHTSLCRALGAVDISRVLLVDVLKVYPSIKGLLFVQTIVEVAPEVLDAGSSTSNILRETILHMLLVISASSSEKQQLLLGKSGLTMLSSIAEAIGSPFLLEMVDRVASSRAEAEFVDRLWREWLFPTCRSDSEKKSELIDATHALEMLVSLHGSAIVTQYFSLDKFRALCSSEGSGNIDLARILSAFVRGLIPTVTAGVEDGEESTLVFVHDAMDWLLSEARARFSSLSDAPSSIVVDEIVTTLVMIMTLPQSHVLQQHRKRWTLTLLEVLPETRLRTVLREAVVIVSALAAGYRVRSMGDAMEENQAEATTQLEEDDKDKQDPSDEGHDDGADDADITLEVVKNRDEEDTGVPNGLPSLKTSGSSSSAAVIAPTVAGGVPVINSNDYRAMAKRAAALAKQDRLGGGRKSAYQTKMSDIGALGIGLQLYFMLTKYLTVTFLVMGLIALPTIVVNYFGHGITTKMSDPLQLGYASLGNEGVHEDTAGDPKMCLPQGVIDCNWTTVDTPFTTNPVKVSWIITISDCLYSLIFLLFYVVYRYRAQRAIDTHQNENLTPAKYAVHVRGLPPDATEAEILQHFDHLYDPTQEETSYSLWFGCCWSRKRHKVKYSMSRNAINRSRVQNIEHLDGVSSVTKNLYLNTWIAEVSIGHPTGGLLRTFLSMEALTQSISETRVLIKNLEDEKTRALGGFKPRDEKLIHASKKRLDKLCEELEKKKKSIKTLKVAAKSMKQIMDAANALPKRKSSASFHAKNARAKVKAAAKAAKTAATTTQQAFDWEACECAFVVFNNLESRRRCLHDYRHSTHWLPHKYQPRELRFRDGKFRLKVTAAPEPSNILWENLEVTDRGRFYRRSLTIFITFLLLIASAAVISGAQSAQQQFKSKMPPAGLCERSLPMVFHGGSQYTKETWSLKWYEDKSCTKASDYYIAYTNGIVNPLSISNPAVPKDPNNPPTRCTDPCVSERDDESCSTMPCFDQDLVDAGGECETYQASHMLYCYCTQQLTESIDEHGIVNGAKVVWNKIIPCRGFIKDYLKKNGFIVIAAAVVVIVNFILNAILRAMADFERHSSESGKATAIALKMFLAQFLNTAIIVLLVNASLGVEGVPVIGDLLKGKYRDFERDWYPSVGMGITTTMLINVFVPQIILCLQMFVIAPLTRCLTRRSIRTQEQMNKLYAGPTFDISVRYPMVLNSLFVTMVFCGGSPILLFIAAFTAAGTYWFDKLSLIHLYSVKTAYDEELGQLALTLLPWTLIFHLAFSTWMYGNPKLMKATPLDLPWVLRLIGLNSLVDKYGDDPANEEILYNAFLEEAKKVDLLGKYGFVVKVVRTNVMLIFLFLVGAVLGLLVSTIWLSILYPVLQRVATSLFHFFCGCFRRPTSSARSVRRSSELPIDSTTNTRANQKAKAPPPPVILPEYTDFFRMSVNAKFRPDTRLGFRRNEEGELIRVWSEDHFAHNRKRAKGEPMRTWEALQAPVKSYAIEMNDKYRLAVAEIVAASKMLRMGVSELHHKKVIPVPDEDSGDNEAKVTAAAIAADIMATEPVSDVPAHVNPTPDEPTTTSAGVNQEQLGQEKEKTTKKKASSSSSSSSEDEK